MEKREASFRTSIGDVPCAQVQAVEWVKKRTFGVAW